jgi:hypothetical protein
MSFLDWMFVWSEQSVERVLHLFLAACRTLRAGKRWTDQLDASHLASLIRPWGFLAIARVHRWEMEAIVWRHNRKAENPWG